MLKMRRLAVTIFFLLISATWSLAQEHPMSPPPRSPVPLTQSEQERRLAEEAARKTPNDTPTQKPTQIKVPAALVGRHISSGNSAIDAIVIEAAAKNGIDPCLILSVMRAESGFNRVAVSPKGAAGLMQLMPATATRFGVKNIFDPRENVLGAAVYLRWLLDRFGGDVRLALAGYNAGEGAVEFYGNRIPPFLETQNYVRTIYSRYVVIHTGAAAHAEATPEPARPAETPNGPVPTYTQIIRFTSSTNTTARSSQ
jgi:soluble lytic murein transglycosylase-like protein